MNYYDPSIRAAAWLHRSACGLLVLVASLIFVVAVRDADIPLGALSFAVFVLAIAILRSGLTFASLVIQLHERTANRELLIQFDSLTGALSRHQFLEILEGRLRQIRTQQMAGKPSDQFSLLLIDVDHFKQLNDGFGHGTGDLVLQGIAEEAKGRNGWTIGRIGGDEFAVIVNTADAGLLHDDISRYFELLAKRFKGSHKTSGFRSISVGVATAPTDASQSSNLLNCSDTALYAGKRSGRGQITFFNANMQRQQLDNRQIARQLHAAIILGHLSVHYQPICDSLEKVVAAEALVRWRDPLLGNIPPDRFIPVAEQSDLIEGLGEWVFRRVCRDFAASGYPRISINVSGRQLRSDRIVNMFASSLREFEHNADNFVLEITETSVIDATPDVRRRIDELRVMGFKIALDDFGTGNSNFTTLRSLPIDIIKIDRSYIQKLASDPLARIFVNAIGELARAQDLLVIPEGIETREELQLSKLAGATRFQGFYVGNPHALAGSLSEMSEVGGFSHRVS